ncbi:hypothetical protein V1477_011355 [Vespula maculifrons]|uniref:Uncharacterized protein n=1 Tax=Vespula maculifrons TaxID=7453 RepID=A0ABD2C4I8_VESMC
MWCFDRKKRFIDRRTQPTVLNILYPDSRQTSDSLSNNNDEDDDDDDDEDDDNNNNNNNNHFEQKLCQKKEG